MLLRREFLVLSRRRVVRVLRAMERSETRKRSGRHGRHRVGRAQHTRCETPDLTPGAPPQRWGGTRTMYHAGRVHPGYTARTCVSHW